MNFVFLLFKKTKRKARDFSSPNLPLFFTITMKMTKHLGSSYINFIFFFSAHQTQRGFFLLCT